MWTIFWMARLRGRGDMVFNTTFSNISIISWWSILLVEEAGVPRENHWPAASHWQTLSHTVVSSTPRHELTTLMVIGIDCIGTGSWDHDRKIEFCYKYVNMKICSQKDDNIFHTWQWLLFCFTFQTELMYLKNYGK